jgi:hypothetical protein
LGEARKLEEKELELVRVHSLAIAESLLASLSSFKEDKIL